MLKKAHTFNDFNKLILRGNQILLTFGQYCAKNIGCSNPAKRRKVIQYFYKRIN
jgi:hypothetical protein